MNVVLTRTDARARKAGDRWIPWIFVAGMLVVVAVNVGLVYFAVDSWTGLAVERPYERGLAYNKVLAAAARQEALGWHLNLSLRRPDHASDDVVIIEARDRDGRPLNGLTIEAELTRPLEPTPPQIYALRPVGEGRYAGRIDGELRPGQWDVRLSAFRGDDVFHARHRAFLR